MASMAAVLGAGFVFLGPVLMRKTGSVRLGAHVSSLFLYCSVVSICWMTGGIRAPGIMWLTVVPTFGLIFSGFGGGLLWGLVVAATGFAFFWADAWEVGWIWPPIASDDWIWIEAMAVTGLSMVILVLFTLHRWLHLQLAEDLEEARSQLEHQAYYDRLTRLPNRELLEERLRGAVGRFGDGVEPFAFLFVDLDDFKAVNDSLGHASGDQVMKELGGRLAGSIRESDLVARTGGDEFVVLLEGVEDLEEAEPLVDRVCDVFNRPLHVGTEEIHLSASIGLARATVCCDQNEREDRNIEIIRRTADRAMYRAKERTGTTVEYVSPDDRIESSRRIQRENRIREGIEAGEFVPYYQPIFRLADNAIMGAEVLARWDHPERGVLSPAEFLPIVERRALIFEFTRAIVDKVLADLETLDGEALAPSPFWCHLNVSAQEVSDSEHMAGLADRLASSSADWVDWRLEITESQWVRDEIDFRALKRERIGLVIDDFGKGYSSLGRLADLPCEGIKLDRQFVQDVDKESEHQALVHIVSELGELLDVPVVAEGIETAAELEVVCEAGVSAAQGYYFAHPGSFDALKEALEG
jgi:diguanylate cyclase (GGDEF)-like protein